jgi:hypothetical protein
MPCESERDQASVLSIDTRFAIKPTVIHHIPRPNSTHIREKLFSMKWSRTTNQKRNNKFLLRNP